MKKYIFLSLFFLGAGFLLALFVIHPKTITVTKNEPGQIVYVAGKVPDPVVIEKIIYKEGKVSFTQNLPYTGKVIKTASVDMVYDGIYHVKVDDNSLSVEDEIVGNVQTTIRGKADPLKIFDSYLGVKTGLKDILPIVGFGIEKPLILGMSWAVSGEWEIDNGLRNGTYRAEIHGRF
jgi:hypothetical protein